MDVDSQNSMTSLVAMITDQTTREAQMVSGTGEGFGVEDCEVRGVSRRPKIIADHERLIGGL